MKYILLLLNSKTPPPSYNLVKEIKFGKSAHKALEIGALIAASTTLKT